LEKWVRKVPEGGKYKKGKNSIRRGGGRRRARKK